MTVKRAAGKRAVALAQVAVAEIDEPSDLSKASGVVEVFLKDGRQFSVLAATPFWFEAAFARLGLPYFFGPSILFVRDLGDATVRQAVAAMAREGEGILCQYDTPRTTLPRLLSEFKARHF